MTPTPLGTPARNKTAQPSPQACGSLCPLCQGHLLRLRDAFRCGRCGFVLCVGCADGEVADPTSD